jgi:hypothetical protein
MVLRSLLFPAFTFARHSRCATTIFFLPQKTERRGHNCTFVKEGTEVECGRRCGLCQSPRVGCISTTGTGVSPEGSGALARRGAANLPKESSGARLPPNKAVSIA